MIIDKGNANACFLVMSITLWGLKNLYWISQEDVQTVDRPQTQLAVNLAYD